MSCNVSDNVTSLCHCPLHCNNQTPGVGTHLYCYNDITTRSQRSSFTTSWTSSNSKGFCPVTKINSWFIHLSSFPVIFLNTRVAARMITNKMPRIVSTRGVFTGNGKCSNESHFALAWPSPGRITLTTLHITTKQRHRVINMANFLLNYWLTRTNNCLIIIPARLPTPVAGRHFYQKLGKSRFNLTVDCWPGSMEGFPTRSHTVSFSPGQIRSLIVLLLA